MEWGAKFNFIWLWTIPAALAVFYWASARKKSAMRRFGDLELVERLVASFSPSKRRLKRIFIMVALAMMVLALAQPHFRQKEITLERKGVDVMIAVDVSQSMLSKDVLPNRLEKTKLELSTLVDRLKQNRIGIVAFAGEAFIQCPLTIDQSAVKLFLSTLNPNLVPTPGTSLGSAIAVATQAFSENELGYKAMILLTDGEDHESDPLKVATIAKEKGIRIFTIGIGTADGSTVPSENPAQGFKKDRYGQPVISKMDEPMLKDIARLTGGEYYRASRAEIEIDSLSYAIGQIAQKDISKQKIIQYEESYQMLLWIAFILLCAEWVLSERKGIL